MVVMPKSPLSSALQVALHGTCSMIEQFLLCFPNDPAQGEARQLLDHLKSLQAKSFSAELPSSQHLTSSLPNEPNPFAFFQTDPPTTTTPTAEPAEPITAVEEDPFAFFSPMDLPAAPQETPSSSLFDEWVAPPTSSAPTTQPKEPPNSSSTLDTIPVTTHAKPPLDPFAQNELALSATEKLLRSLRQRMESVELQSIQIPQRLWEESPEVIWKTCHLSLLRLPIQDARSWNERLLALAKEHGFRSHDAPSDRCPDLIGQPFSLPTLCSPTGEVFSGLQFSSLFDHPQEISPLLERSLPTTLDLQPWLQAAALALYLLEHDHTLHHALYSAYSFGMIQIDPQQREIFKKHFLLRLQNIFNAKSSAEQMFSLWELDEAFHSLLHNPIAANKSGWDQFYKKTRDLLFQAKEHFEKESNKNISLQELPSEYRTVYEKRLTEKDIAIQDGKPPGKVLSTLRVWMNLEGKTWLGRVIYRG